MSSIMTINNMEARYNTIVNLIFLSAQQSTNYQLCEL